MQMMTRVLRWNVPVWGLVVGGMAVAVALAVAAFLGVADTLPGDTLVAVRPVDVPADGMDQWDIWPVATGVSGGIQLGLLALLFGGLPAAILAWALTAPRVKRDRPWSRAWGNVFWAGFLFQLSSVALYALIFLGALLSAGEGETNPARAIAAAGVPSFLAVMSALWGLRCWRVLQQRVQDTPLTIAPHEGVA